MNTINLGTIMAIGVMAIVVMVAFDIAKDWWSTKRKSGQTGLFDAEYDKILNDSLPNNGERKSRKEILDSSKRLFSKYGDIFKA
jgi:hypothetical protein